MSINTAMAALFSLVTVIRLGISQTMYRWAWLVLIFLSQCQLPYIVLVDGKKSLIGGSAIHGMEGVRFYTQLKTVTSRWPSGIRKGTQFHFESGKNV